jgi:hypothetical protein
LTEKQKWIGYADVKSTPVHFYVQRNSHFNTKGIPIPFNLAVVNEGNAMDSTSGIFTAPRPGIYFFSFTGMAQFPASSSRLYLQVGIYLNGGLIEVSDNDEANKDSLQNETLTLQSTLNLKSGDQVWVAIYFITTGGFLYDTSNHHTHFTGFMLDEEVVALL